MSRARAVARALGEALGTDVSDVRLDAAGGGCINSAATTEVDGERFFVKWNDHPLPRQFEAEAAGLRAMAESGSGLVTPKPVAWSDAGPGESFLVMEYLPAGTRVSGFDRALGRGLAMLHRTTSSRGFGFELDGYCGATPQPNRWTADWKNFYTEQRLGHQVKLAAKRGMDKRSLKVFDGLLDVLGGLLHGDEPPALIHGDLWSGNLHVAPDGAPALIDPAAYFGHREAELGMMVLFGGFGRVVFEAYEEVYPLADGWRDRLDLYTLYHVLNHYNLFGGGYGEQAVRLAKRYA